MIGATTSSVTPGYTVDSNTTTQPGLRFLPTVRAAAFSGPRSGVKSIAIGVGTVMIMNEQRLRKVASDVKHSLISRIVLLFTDPVRSKPL